MIVTQIRPRRRSCCSNLVLRRAPRPHDMKLRQRGLCSRPCWSPCAWNHRSVKTARKGALHEKRSSPARASFFVVLTGWCFRATSRSDTACNTLRRQLPGVRRSSCVTPQDRYFLSFVHFLLDICRGMCSKYPSIRKEVLTHRKQCGICTLSSFVSISWHSPVGTKVQNYRWYTE